MTDTPIKGPGHGAKPKARAPVQAKQQRAAVTAAIAVRVEQSVAQAAHALEIDHKRVLTVLLEIAESPWQQPGARVAAAAKLADIIGTTKAPTTNHLHLHHALKAVPDDALETRIAQLIEKYA